MVAHSKKKVAVYARVSTRRQKNEATIENQLKELNDYCKSKKMIIYKVYSDNGYSGASDNRPELNELLRDAENNKFNTVIVLRLDRLGRSLTHLIDTVQRLKELKIDFISLKENIDTTSDSGRLVFHIFCAIAEFERGLITERIKAGIERRRLQGKSFGRKKVSKQLSNIYKMRETGMSLSQIASKVNLSRTRVQQLLVEKEKALKYFEKGSSARQIARNLGSQNKRALEIVRFFKESCSETSSTLYHVQKHGNNKKNSSLVSYYTCIQR